MKIKPVIVPAITLLIGIAIGVGGMAFAVAKGPNQERLIETGLLTSLNFQKGLNLSAEDYHASQEFVRGYFDFTDRPIPAPIAQYIQAIPQGSGHDMRRFADAAVISSADSSSAIH
ncbi:MAG: hypothetical protein ABSE62_14575 [Chthoniobacteraceae bacterium]